MPQIYSPDWFCQVLNKVRSQLEEALVPILVAPLGSLLAWALLLALSVPLTYARYENSADLGLVDPALMTISLFLGYLILWRAVGLKGSGFMVGASILSLSIFWVRIEYGLSLLALAVFVGSFLLLQLVFVLFQSRSTVHKMFVAVFAVLLIINIFLYVDNGWNSAFFLLRVSPVRLMFLIYLPLLESGLPSALNVRDVFRLQLWYPFQFLYPLPTRLRYWLPAPERGRIQARGLVDVMIGLLFLLFFTRSKSVHFDKYHMSGVGEYLYYGCFVYLSTYFGSCSAISIPVGLARLLGFAMPDAYALPLLAASPFERWRRWNQYFYNFFRWTVYLPVARKLKSPFSAIMATFLVTALFHTLNFGMFSVLNVAVRQNLLSEDIVAFFLVHGLIVYFTLKSNLRIFQGTRRCGWIGVATTWLLMSGVHILHRWL